MGSRNEREPLPYWNVLTSWAKSQELENTSIGKCASWTPSEADSTKFPFPVLDG